MFGMLADSDDCLQYEFLTRLGDGTDTPETKNSPAQLLARAIIAV